jgi:hypothetical protein
VLNEIVVGQQSLEPRIITMAKTPSMRNSIRDLLFSSPTSFDKFKNGIKGCNYSYFIYVDDGPILAVVFVIFLSVTEPFTGGRTTENRKQNKITITVANGPLNRIIAPRLYY